jgi:hypothetical protein
MTTKPAAAPMTRQEFERRRTGMERVLKRDGYVLAAVSVVFGVGQLVLIRWAETHLPRRPEIALELTVFIAYILLILVLAWRLARKLKAASVACPQCGAALDGLSGRVAVATGKCDRCGGQVIA